MGFDWRCNWVHTDRMAAEGAKKERKKERREELLSVGLRAGFVLGRWQLY